MPALFGRAWKVQVLAPADQSGNQTLLTVSSSDTETQALRVTFETEQYFAALWYAEVKIYNPNLQTVQTITEGSIVSISAGYQSEGTIGEIFRGVLFQALFSKEDANTVVLTLICFVGIDELINNFTKVTSGPRATQREVVLAMAQNCLTPIPVAYAAPDSDFKAGALPRSSTIFGTPNTLFANIAANNDMSFFIGPDGLHIGKLDGSGSAKPDIIYAPPLQAGQTAEPGVDYRLIGTPQQTQLGVSFRVLMDSRLQFKLPAMRVQLKNAVIQQAQFLPGQYPLTPDGVYFMAGVQFVGDTRGNTWEAEVTGVSSVQGLLGLPGGAN
jgi:hypothetical protein